MKFATVVSLLLASKALAKEETHLRRQLQFDLEEFFGGEGNDEGSSTTSSPLDDMLDDLATGLEELMNMTALISMDPLSFEGDSFVFNDTIGLTNCTAPINITVFPASLTGLSTVAMERFELIPDSDVENSNWWSGFMSWTGTFDMLLTAGSIVMEGGFSLQSDDLECLGEGAPEDGFFTTGVKIALINPVMEMQLDIGGNSPMGFFNTMFFGPQADSIETSNVTFTYDTWTIEFDNPEVNQTIHVGDLFDTVDAFLSNAPNVTDLLQDMDGLEGYDGIDSFLQDQVNVVMKGASIPL